MGKGGAEMGVGGSGQQVARHVGLWHRCPLPSSLGRWHLEGRGLQQLLGDDTNDKLWLTQWVLSCDLL